jgi:glycopeptide antibiotics resistance protein
MKYPVTLLVGVIALHLVANALGVYDTQIEAGFVWIDNVLHMLVGVAVGLFWLRFLHLRKPGASAAFRAGSTVAIVLTAAVIWELLEFAFYISMQTYAVSLNIYSPSLLEAVEDVVSNVVGGLLACIAASVRRNTPDSPPTV